MKRRQKPKAGHARTEYEAAHAAQETEDAARTPTLFELVDPLETEIGIGPNRRHVLERPNGELVFQQPEIDAIIKHAINEVADELPLAGGVGDSRGRCAGSGKNTLRTTSEAPRCPWRRRVALGGAEA